jgi:hypothetical protein
VKYPITLLAIAAVMLLVGLGIRMHADWKYTNKMFYHTVGSGLYEFHDVFAERKIGDTLQLSAVILGSAGGLWFVVLAINRDRRRQAVKKVERLK